MCNVEIIGPNLLIELILRGKVNLSMIVPGIGGPGLAPKTPGTFGFPGIEGIPGMPGALDFPGIEGIPGTERILGLAVGTEGIPGIEGMPGTEGILGLAVGTGGIPGVEGMPGTFGFPGIEGIPGTEGALGLAVGTEGIPGIEGMPGTEGILLFTFEDVAEGIFSLGTDGTLGGLLGMAGTAGLFNIVTDCLFSSLFSLKVELLRLFKVELSLMYEQFTESFIVLFACSIDASVLIF